MTDSSNGSGSEATSSVVTGDDGEISRAEKLDRFIESSPHYRSEDDRRAAFLLGALVGKISSYQAARRGVSQTLRRQYPIDRMTATRAVDLVSAVLDRNNVYAQEDNIDLLYREYVERLVDALGASDTTDWVDTLDEATLKYDYGVGMAYGLTDRTDANPDRSGGDD
jgi:CRISPR-associated protein Cas8b/Csh1 subtype I-B